MGRPYITFFEKPNILFKCAVCNVDVTDIRYKIRNIETTEGPAIQCYKVRNYFENETNIGNVKYFEHLHGMFDPDTIFKTYNTGTSISVHCVNCKQHWGWKYIKPMTDNESFFILTNVSTKDALFHNSYV